MGTSSVCFSQGLIPSQSTWIISKRYCFTVYPIKYLSNATVHHCIYLMYHISILQQNNNVSRCLFPGNFAPAIPCNPLLAAAPFLSVSSCPAGYAKSQQDLRSVCIQLWHWALWRFALYIVHLQTSGISRTQQGLPSVYAEVVCWLANCFGPQMCDRRKCIALAFLSITS